MNAAEAAAIAAHASFKPQRVTVEGIDLCIREATRDDRRYIGPTWSSSYRRRSSCAESVFRIEHRKVIDRCLDRSKTLVVCAPDSPNVLFGFACGEPWHSPPMLHAAYVANELRGFGLGRTLISLVASAVGSVVTTHRFNPRASSRFTFNPYLAGFYE